jgi:predicted transcriptional regulator of viral defense system
VRSNDTRLLSARLARREQLSKVLRCAAEIVTVDDAVAALFMSRNAAAKLLSRWNRQGFLRRIRRGVYAPVPLAASAEDLVLEDPWMLVPVLFSPGYIAGATAAEHWDLTDQMFRTVFVHTVGPVRHAKQTIYGTTFVLQHITQHKLFGTKPLWRNKTKVQISDVHRTIVDMLDNPSEGGGIRHVADCLREYFRRTDADIMKLVRYSDAVGNGAVFKRLGFLTEQAAGPPELIKACKERLTHGIAKLDPAIESKHLLKRWRLWLPNRAQASYVDD